MRSAPWAILAVLCLLAAAFHVRSSASARVAPVAAGSPNATSETQSWIVFGPWMVSKQDAERGALEKARVDLIEFLRAQNPPFAWTPSLEYIRDKLMSHCPTKLDDPSEERGTTRSVNIGSHMALEQEYDFSNEGAAGTQLGVMRRVCLKVALTDQNYEDMRRLDRLESSQNRQWILVRILAGLVALLTAVAAYFRLDEATKGYYSAWLRLAAVSFVGAVGAALVFFI